MYTNWKVEDEVNCYPVTTPIGPWGFKKRERYDFLVFLKMGRRGIKRNIKHYYRTQLVRIREEMWYYFYKGKQ